MILETQRLFLREMTLSDLDALLLVLGDAESMRYYPKPFDREMVEKWIDRHRRNYEQHGVGLWAMVLKATGEVIGDCGLVWQEGRGTSRTRNWLSCPPRPTNAGLRHRSRVCLPRLRL
ncbi:hypothetical protein NSTCB13_01183 [Nostoc sp. DSM 114160]